MTAIESYLQQQYGKPVATKYSNRLRGGLSNSKGNDYEITFAVYLVARLFSRGVPSTDTVIQSQAPDYVDDLVCFNRVLSSKQNYQLKDSPSITWSSGIADDFRIQQDLNVNYHCIQQSQTILVISDEKCQRRLLRKCPAAIASHTDCVHFKSENFNALLVANDPQIQPFRDLCAFPHETDKVTVVWQALAGSWVANKAAPITAEEVVLNAANGYCPGYFKLPTTGTVSQSLVNILDNIKGLSYRVEHGFLTYVLQGCVSGRVQIGSEELNELERKLSENTVTDWVEFIQVIGRGDV